MVVCFVSKTMEEQKKMCGRLPIVGSAQIVNTYMLYDAHLP